MDKSGGAGGNERRLVAELHDAVAHSANRAEASTRPADTTPLELRLMVRDAIGKLRLEPRSELIEVGCGTGVFALPIARKVARYAGTDFAGQALAVLEAALAQAAPPARWDLVAADFLDADLDALGWTGAFDRALMYAVVHYARDDDEGIEFLRRLTACLAPGGRALVGNIPLAELAGDGPRIAPGSVSQRVGGLARWVAGQDDVARRSAAWKLRSIALQTLKARLARDKPSFETAALPAGFTAELTRPRIERWLSEIPGIEHHWLLPAAGIPLTFGRADLILVRR